MKKKTEEKTHIQISGAQKTKLYIIFTNLFHSHKIDLNTFAYNDDKKRCAFGLRKKIYIFCILLDRWLLRYGY